MNPEADGEIERYHDNIDLIVGNLLMARGFSEDDAESYSAHLFSMGDRFWDEESVLRCSEYLRRAYMSTLGKPHSRDDEYDLMEQSMMGHIFGRTSDEKDMPVPLEEALERVSVNGDSDLLTERGLEALSTGLAKLRRRLERN